MAPPKAKAKSTKKTTKATKNHSQKNVVESPEFGGQVPLELQQLLLNIFSDAFAERLGSDIHPLLQEVKGHLYRRDFAAAFGRGDYLEAYAARWSPSRALGYLQVLTSIHNHLLWTSQKTEDARSKVVCIGGGAGAEVVALGGFANYLRRTDYTDGVSDRLELVAIDIADWSSVVHQLSQNVTTAPVLSKYASASAQAANAALVSADSLDVNFRQHDVLHTDFSLLRPSIEGVSLITIMFTLNELYSTSLALTQKFLLNLTTCLEDGALLLVVDSPGSYSTISLNGTEKNYPMQWLLDHTLLREDGDQQHVAWKKIQEDESRWFRLDAALRYPIELENMRFQMHLYQKVG